MGSDDVLRGMLAAARAEVARLVEENARLREVVDAERQKGAREGWMRAVVFYTDMDAEGDANVREEADRRWPLSRLDPKVPR